MKAAKAQEAKENPAPHPPVHAAPWLTLDFWHRRPREPGAVPLTPEERSRMIELAAQYQASRHRVTPEFDLRDWLDAVEEVKSH